MKLSTIIISTLLVGILFTGFYNFAIDLSTGYGSDLDVSYLNTYNKSLALAEEINSDYNEVVNFSSNKGVGYEIITFIPDTLSLLKNVITYPYTILTETMQGSDGNPGALQQLSMPAWVGIMFKIMLPIFLIFAIVAVFLRYKHV